VLFRSDFNEDLYGKTIEVIFRQKIREETKFSGLEELKRHISADVEQVRELFGVTS
jgi:riboflavin kinase/FMN adenylyltransferase